MTDRDGLDANRTEVEAVRADIVDLKRKIAVSSSDRELLLVYNTQLTELLRKENTLLIERNQLRGPDPQAQPGPTSRAQESSSQDENRTIDAVPGRPAVKKGTVADVKWSGGGAYSAKITKVRANGLLEVRWIDDGTCDTKVPWGDVGQIDELATKMEGKLLIRRQAELARREELRGGAKVMARWNEGERWEGTIVGTIRDEGMVEVDWEDGSRDFVLPEHVEVLDSSFKASFTSQDGGSGDRKRKFEDLEVQEGSVVKAEWQGGDAFPAWVCKMNEDGTLRVRWIDGGEEDVARDKVTLDVLATRVWKESREWRARAMEGREDLEAGGKVLVSYGNDFWPATVVKCLWEEGMVCARWDSTGEEAAVLANDVEIVEERPGAGAQDALRAAGGGAQAALEAGTVVNVDLGGGTRWPAQVVRGVGDGRVRIRWSDGELEEEMAAEKCEADGAATRRERKAVQRRRADLERREGLRPGARVRSMQGDHARARVGAVREEDGMLKIMWDGGGWTWLAPHGVHVETEAEATQMRRPLRRGMAVQARWEHGDWWAATVGKVLGDGRVVVEWEDGSAAETVPRAEVEVDDAREALEVKGRARRREELARRSAEVKVGARVMVKCKGGPCAVGPGSAYHTGVVMGIDQEFGMVAVKLDAGGAPARVIVSHVELVDS